MHISTYLTDFVFDGMDKNRENLSSGYIVSHNKTRRHKVSKKVQGGF